MTLRYIFLRLQLIFLTSTVTNLTTCDQFEHLGTNGLFEINFVTMILYSYFYIDTGVPWQRIVILGPNNAYFPQI